MKEAEENNICMFTYEYILYPVCIAWDGVGETNYSTKNMFLNTARCILLGSLWAKLFLTAFSSPA